LSISHHLGDLEGEEERGKEEPPGKERKKAKLGKFNIFDRS
jgi:hypothetical protein